jgi:hypothetical protein
MVLQSFKYMGEGVNDVKQYLKQMEVLSIAFYLAKSTSHFVELIANQLISCKFVSLTI